MINLILPSKSTKVKFALYYTTSCLCRENLNLIRQKIEKLENIQVEDIKGSIAWRIITPGKLLTRRKIRNIRTASILLSRT